MTTVSAFNVNKYTGTWYELMHYKTWFLPNSSYNTKAEYSISRTKPNTLIVRNSSINNGKEVSSVGSAKLLGGNNLLVSFPRSERNKIENSNVTRQSQAPSPQRVSQQIIRNQLNVSPHGRLRTFVQGVTYVDTRGSEENESANYVVEAIWVNSKGEYIFSVVTDPKRESLYVLSRYRNISLEAYNELMKYVYLHFDEKLIIQTPQFY